MRRLARGSLLVFPALAALACAATKGPGPAASGQAHAEKPALLVLLVVDQMRADYVDRYGAHWRHGLRRLYDHGASFIRAFYPYLNTITCAGHATLSTGSYPNTHGMIFNAWWDRGQGRRIECTEDRASTLIPLDGQPLPGADTALGDSAVNLRIPTLADDLRAQARPSPRVVSLSMKARAAIMMGGRAPDAVAWFENSTWVTAKAFASAPPPWLAQAVSARPLDAVATAVWEKVLDPGAYRGVDDAIGEAPPRGLTAVFPHELRASTAAPPAFQYSRWSSSPMADVYLADLAIAAVDALKLGGGNGTDYLAVSFSALDAVGHSFGPESHEVQDALARLDVTLGGFLDALDRRVGEGRYLLALSSDHGVAPIPEQLAAGHQDAGRVAVQEIWRRVDAAAVDLLGPGKHVVNVEYTDIYLADGLYEKMRDVPGALARLIAAAKSVPGIADVFTRDELASPAGPTQRAAALSFFPGRSGDLIAVPRRYHIPVTAGTTHGSAQDYDQHVPVILYGAGVKPGRYDRAVSPADVAPTMARAAGVTMARAAGRPLLEALAR